MTTFLVTGATGNIGQSLIGFLLEKEANVKVIAAVRDVVKAKKNNGSLKNLDFRQFDFKDSSSFSDALAGVDTVFLLRPPQISKIHAYFKPLLKAISKSTVRQLLFLSGQGAEQSSMIPHHKIESLVKAYGIPYVFLRPSYFMQNLTTTLYKDIVTKRKIILPAGKAKFNWVDVSNIAEVAAHILLNFNTFKNKAYEITGPDNLSFEHAVAIINRYVKHPLVYKKVNPLSFFLIKKKEGMATGFILVMLVLHFLPRFQKAPRVSTFYSDLLGKAPTTLDAFVKREKSSFEKETL